jgi:hypothetical protein
MGSLPMVSTWILRKESLSAAAQGNTKQRE